MRLTSSVHAGPHEHFAENIKLPINTATTVTLSNGTQRHGTVVDAKRVSGTELQYTIEFDATPEEAALLQAPLRNIRLASDR